jgi:hypothetical protein
MVLMTALAVGCAGATANNRLAADLSREDQASRTGGSVSRSDQDRVILILNELAHNRIISPEDKFNAALILQHSPMTFRGDTLVAKSPDNYLLAHYLARSSVESGYARAKPLVAQTLDRYLSMTTGCQKYGTNRFINQQTGAEELAPIDRRTTDEERAELGVPPLAKLLSQFREQRKPCT